MPRFRHMLLAALAIPALAIGAVACSDDDDSAESTSTASAQDVDAINARIQRNERLFALVTIDGLRLHEIDAQVNEEGVIDPEALPKVRQFVRLQSLTDWPTELATEAEDVRLQGVALLAALEDADLEAAKEPAEAVHEGSHEFNEQVWNIVVAELAPEEGGPEEDDDAEATPAAGDSETAVPTASEGQ